MKSYRIIYSPDAQAQLVNLYFYIADAASAEIADRFTSGIASYCERLDSFPYRGSPRDDLRPGLRTVTFRRRTVIAYEINEDEVTIAGIFYGGQDFESALREPD